MFCPSPQGDGRRCPPGPTSGRVSGSRVADARKTEAGYNGTTVRLTRGRRKGIRMLHSTEQLHGFAILATNGEAGRIEAFLFDAATWAVHYLVARTGPPLVGRLVLVAPGALRAIDHAERTLAVAVTCAQVEDGPEIDLDRPDTPPQGIGLARLYSRSAMWGAPGVYSAGTYPEALGGTAPPPVEEPPPHADPEAGAPSLCNTRLVVHSRVRALNDELGRVTDLIVDDAAWAIRYMVVDTGTWRPGRLVLIAPAWIRNGGWCGGPVSVGLECAAIRQGPEYDPSRALSRDDEEALYRHHGWPGYWEEAS